MELSMEGKAILRKEVEWVEEQEKIHGEGRRWLQNHWLTGSLWDAVEKYRSGLRGRSETVEALQQEENICGSYMCFAGHMVIQHAPEKMLDIYDGGSADTFRSVCGDIIGLDRSDPKKHTLERMFSSSNSAREIRRLAELIADEPL